jgi:hypothetical protein
MAISNSNGAQLTVLTTEHTLGTIAIAGVFQLFIDASVMAAGDTLELRAKVKVRSVGTTREYIVGTYNGAQTSPVLSSIPIPSTNEIVFTLTQTAGTVRTFPWEILQVDG